MLQKVVRSTVIDAPIERVWQVLRDFNSHDQWHDVVETSRIEANEASAQVGCVRSFTLKDGNRIREQLLTLDDREHKSTYCIVEATVPLQRYVATVTLKPVTDGNRTFWHWESSFATPPGRERELREMVARDVYEAGFANLRRHLRQGADLRAPRSAPLPTALPLPTRRSRARRLRRRRAADRAGRRSAAARARRGAHPPARDRRQLHRCLPAPRLDPARCCSRAARPAWRPRAACSTSAPASPACCPATAWRASGRCQGAYCSVRTRAGRRVVRLPPRQSKTRSPPRCCSRASPRTTCCTTSAASSRGTRLLVHAAAGGVGLLVCAWARRLGATVIGTVSSETKARIAREHGCEHVIVTRDYRFADAVQATCGGADVVIDGLGDAAFDENLAALAPCGHWISLGQASGPLRAIDPNLLVHKSLSFSRPVVFAYVATRQALAARAESLWQALADGTIKAPPIERHALDAAAQAHARLESRATVGALVLIA